MQQQHFLKVTKAFVTLEIFIVLLMFSNSVHAQQPDDIKPPDVIISTDIGGDDPDDYQSLIHLLLYGDRFSLQGFISSPPGKGRIANIFEVLNAYQQDYQHLYLHNRKFPHPDTLKGITKQGAIDVQQKELPTDLSEGAAWIIEKSNELFPEYLYILVWGSLTDVAQAVHHRPSIKKNIRIYSIGSWNTKLDPKARDYLFSQHKDLWWIENNSSFRGMYKGGFQDGDWGNESFVNRYVKDYGALGKLFWEKKKDIKMGDTPSVLFFLSGNPDNPTLSSWGGTFYQPFSDRNYWTDLPDENLRQDNFDGAATVNRHRALYLKDWAERMALLPYTGRRK